MDKYIKELEQKKNLLITKMVTIENTIHAHYAEVEASTRLLNELAEEMRTIDRAISALMREDKGK